MLGGLITATRTLTILPFPGKGTERLADALYYFPFVGALIGAVVTLTAWLIGGVLGWATGAGIAGVALLCWLTGGLHLDGLGDVADAYNPGRPRERMLAIMKDHHVGAFGVVAIVLALLVKVIALAHLALFARWLWIPLPFILSRMIMVLLAVTLPYARPEGGTGKIFVENSRPAHFIAASLIALALCIALAGIAGGMLFLLAFAMGYGLALWMKKCFGGVTGDLLGMSNEVIESAMLFIIAAAMPFLRLNHGLASCL